MSLPEGRLVETAFSVGSGRTALRGLLSGDPSITAVICGNDILALGALVESAARGVNVPRQLSVTGFDDIELAGEISPSLTTIHIPTAEIGRRAAERLLARLEGCRVKRGEELRVDLVVRESSGPPPGSEARASPQTVPRR